MRKLAVVLLAVACASRARADEPLTDAQVEAAMGAAGSKLAAQCAERGYDDWTPGYRACTPAARISEQVMTKRKELATVTLADIPAEARTDFTVFAYPPMQMTSTIKIVKRIVLRSADGAVTLEPFEEKPDTDKYTNAFGAEVQKTTMTSRFKTPDVRKLISGGKDKDGLFLIVVATDGDREPAVFKVKAAKNLRELMP